MIEENQQFANVNVMDCLRQFAESQPNQLAIEDVDRRVTYAQLNKMVDEAALNIRELGIRSGDVVTVLLHDSIEHLVVNCGLARAGAVLFALNTSTLLADIKKTMAEVNSTILVIDGQDRPLANIQQFSIAQICASNDGQFGSPGAVGKQPVMLVQSSGTTGKVKSFLITHEQCMYKYTPVEGGDFYLPSDRFLSLAKMCFHFTRTYFFRLLFSGATLVLERFADIEQRVRFVNEKSITIIQATAFHIVELLAYAEGRDKILFPHHPQLVSGTSPISPKKRLEARSKITSDIRETYGSNETGSVTRCLPEDQDKYPDSVGKITSLLEMRIVDTEGQELPVGEAGSICFRGPGVTTGYIDNQEMNAKHFRNGWFFPGDIGRVNEEGYLFLLGREDDVINNAGVKFYPIEVEKVLLTLDGVREAAAFPWRHESAGQLAAAVVVADKDLNVEDIRKHCRQNLPHHKVPIAISTATALPKNKMGKVLKRQLRAQLENTLRKQKSRQSDRPS